MNFNVLYLKELCTMNIFSFGFYFFFFPFGNLHSKLDALVTDFFIIILVQKCLIYSNIKKNFENLLFLVVVPIVQLHCQIFIRDNRNMALCQIWLRPSKSIVPSGRTSNKTFYVQIKSKRPFPQDRLKKLSQLQGYKGFTEINNPYLSSILVFKTSKQGAMDELSYVLCKIKNNAEISF